MRKLLVPLALVLSFLPTAHCAVQNAQPTDDQKGSALFRECKAEIRVNVDNSKSAEDLDAALLCLRYFQGFTDATMLTSTSICIGDASRGTLIRVYVKFMEDNPKYMDVGSAVGSFLALVKSYPCKPTP